MNTYDARTRSDRVRTPAVTHTSPHQHRHPLLTGPSGLAAMAQSEELRAAQGRAGPTGAAAAAAMTLNPQSHGTAREMAQAQFAGVRRGPDFALQTDAGRYAETPRFLHFDPSTHGPGRFRQPPPAELKPVTFPEVFPGEVGPREDLPRALDRREAFLFVQLRREEWRAQGATAPILLDRSRADETGGMGQMLLGQEVDHLHRWFDEQNDAAGMIGAFDHHLKVLRENAIIDDDYRVVDPSGIQRILQLLAQSGRSDQYPTVDSDQASEMLNAGLGLTKHDLDLENHLLRLDLFGTRVAALHASVRAARGEIEAYYARKAVSAANSELAAIKREKEMVLACLNVVFDVASAGMTVWKGVADIKSKGNDEGKQTALGGGVGALKAVGTFIVNMGYASRLGDARERIKAARAKLSAVELGVLDARLESVLVSLTGYEAMVAELLPLTEKYVEARTMAWIAFAGTASKALPSMGDRSRDAEGDPLSSPSGRGMIQRLLTHVPIYESVASLSEALRWPELDGRVPLGAYLGAHGPRTERILGQMGYEAAKLRWWAARVDAIVDLVSRIHATVGAIGPNTRSPR